MTDYNILKKVLVFDGAMGTMLQEKGLKAGACPELMNLENPEKVKEVHIEYLNAGADVITTNTFGGTRIKLSEYGLENKVEEVNRKAVQAAKEAAAEKKALVAASIGPTGQFVEPLGNMTFSEAYEIFKEQIFALAKEKPNFLILETFADLGEIRAALLAAEDACDIPVIACMTFDRGRTLTGVSPASAAVILESLGAAAVGANCSGGPDELFAVVQEISQNTNLPVIVQPNAGIPELRNGAVSFPLGPQDFLKAMDKYFGIRINLFGSCCGSTPLHTQKLKERLQTPIQSARETLKRSVLASRERVLQIGDSYLPQIIGERINPTARKKFAEALRNKNYGVIQNEAEIQASAGAHLLDVNVGTPGINEAITMEEIINLLQQNIKQPLVIDSTNPEVIEKALQVYQGKALVNSINGEEQSLNNILPLAKRYGAAVIALTLDEKGIPKKAEERLEIASRIMEKCLEYGLKKEDIYVDCLVMTVGTDTQAACETLRAIKLVKEKLGLNTVLGVSNVSHGLPNRSIINSAFLAMAIQNGLDLAIINPLDENMMKSWQSASLLAGRDKNAMNYLGINSGENIKEPVVSLQDDVNFSTDLVTKLVIRGSQNISQVVETLLKDGQNPLTIINEGLIPGLNVVGEKYEKGEYYLPQLMLSAETAQMAFEILEEKMSVDQSFIKGTVIIGTVKGDVHDIGKNMVAAMLKNHGYRIIDLGKNVSQEMFLESAKKEKADFIALSALMTTTMLEIPRTIAYVKKELPQLKVIAGGAVVTRDFSEEAGADAYGKDAVNAVKLLDALREE